MSLVFRQLRHLLPRARAWRLTIDKALRRLIDGIAKGLESSDPYEFGDPELEMGDGVTEFIDYFRGPIKFYDDVYFDLFPETTASLDEWENQFGLTGSTVLTEAERRTRLAGAWKQTGGQSPRYIQDRLQAAGFDVYIHDWWVPGTDTPRDPGSVITDPEKQLINKQLLFQPEPVSVGDGSQVGDPQVTVGGLIVSTIRVTQPISTDPDQWRFFVYFGGQTFGDTANIPANRRDEFEDLCLKLCPAQLWIGLIVNYV